MKSNEILYSSGNNDECYTPAYAVKPIIKYIQQYKDYDWAFNMTRDFTIWCPFDTTESEFVKQISKMWGVKVVHSHIAEEKDFFKYEPEHWDIIVSNPPFTNKRKYFERAFG